MNGAEACREVQSALAGRAGVPYGVGLDLSRDDQTAEVPAGLGLDLSSAGDQPAVMPTGLGLDLSSTGDQPTTEVECAGGRGLALAFAGGREEGPPPLALASLAPSGRPAGGLFQAYLPALDDPSAAQLLAAGVLDREHVAALASLAGAPRRLKPIGIHYSFEIATRPSAVRALREALQWATQRRTLPLWASEYADRVAEFRTATVARRLDGTWSFRGLHVLRTVRLPRALGWPDPSRSRGVASIAEAGDDLYVSFGPVERPALALSAQPPRGPFIACSNSALEAWEASDRSVSLHLRGHGPVLLEVGGVDGTCTLTAHGQTLRPVPFEGRQAFSVPDADTGDATLRCGDE